MRGRRESRMNTSQTHRSEKPVAFQPWPIAVYAPRTNVLAVTPGDIAVGALFTKAYECRRGRCRQGRVARRMTALAWMRISCRDGIGSETERRFSHLFRTFVYDYKPREIERDEFGL
jgi:hypothetical protein